MRGTKYWSSLRTFGLAFAIVLSPALMQTDELGCHSEGNAELTVLEVEVAGEDMIAFAPMQEAYEVMLPEGFEEIVLRAQSSDPAAAVSYNLSDGCEPTAMGEFPAGGGEVAIEAEAVHEGHSLLKVWVHAPEGKANAYSIFLTQPRICQ